MTLIALVCDERDRILAVGDVALSQLDLPPGYRINLPFQNIKDEGAAGDPFSTAAIVDLAQKMVQFGPHLVLWAGSYFFARILIEELVKRKEELTGYNIESYVDEILGIHKKEIEIIYCYSGKDKVAIWSHNCSTEQYAGASYIIGGSGAYRFFEECNIQCDIPLAECKSSLDQVRVRISHLIDVEMFDDAAYFFGVGGAYEIAALSEEKWTKIPYSIAFVASAESGFSINRLINIGYVHDNLCLDLYQTKTKLLELADQPQRWFYIMSIEIENVKRFVVPDFLGRKADQAISIIDLNDLGGESSNLHPTMSFIKLMRKSDEGWSGCWWYYRPAVIGCFPLQGRVAVYVRTFFCREVESWCLNAEFIPPVEKISYYKEDYEAWRRGEGFARNLAEDALPKSTKASASIFVSNGGRGPESGFLQALELHFRKTEEKERDN